MSQDLGIASEPFDRHWWQDLVDRWNASDRPEVLGGLGTVTFHVVDRVGSDAVITWDAQGAALLEPAGTGARVTLSARYDDWKRFIAGQVGPTAMVLTGRLKIDGDASVVLRFAGSFAALAAVAPNI